MAIRDSDVVSVIKAASDELGMLAGALTTVDLSSSEKMLSALTTPKGG